MPNSEDIFELSEYRKNEIARNERATMAMLIIAQKNAYALGLARGQENSMLIVEGLRDLYRKLNNEPLTGEQTDILPELRALLVNFGWA
jgi:hypothetical protein